MTAPTPQVAYVSVGARHPSQAAPPVNTRDTLRDAEPMTPAQRNG